jgi:hypothetical protein
MTDKADKEAAIKEIKAAIAQIEKAEREWRTLSDEVRLKLKLEYPELAKFFSTAEN